MVMYCILCSEYDEVIEGTHRSIIIHEDYPLFWIEWRECPGPFATCPPPIIDLEPLDNISPAEWELMNINTDELRLELTAQ